MEVEWSRTIFAPACSLRGAIRDGDGAGRSAERGPRAPGVVGAWAVATWQRVGLQQAVCRFRAEVKLDVLRDTIPGFPLTPRDSHGALRELAV